MSVDDLLGPATITPPSPPQCLVARRLYGNAICMRGLMARTGYVLSFPLASSDPRERAISSSYRSVLFAIFALLNTPSKADVCGRFVASSFFFFCSRETSPNDRRLTKETRTNDLQIRFKRVYEPTIIQIRFSGVFFLFY